MKKVSLLEYESIFAANCVCDAMNQIESGNIETAIKSLQHALHLLPDCSREEQLIAIAARKVCSFGSSKEG